jgi:hypothetical protein
VAVESTLDPLTIVSPVRDAGGEIIDSRYKYCAAAAKRRRGRASATEVFGVDPY